MPSPRSLASAATAAAVLAALAATAPAGAAAPTTKTLARHLLSPLTLAVDGNDVYVTQNFGGILSKLRQGKAPKTLYHSKNEVGGVSVRGGRIVFTETASNAQGPTDSWLKLLRPSGKARTLAHIRAYENRHNPDGTTTYGVRGIPADCAAQWPTAQLGPAVYTGLKDSHPYATFQTKKKIYVADAGMNAVLSVSWSGHIRTVAVTPAAPLKITQALATGAGVPACAVGLTYYSESVPTDVARGPKGKLLVTTEGGGLGEQVPLGAVYRIDPASGRTKLVARSLFGPTGLAVTRKGDIYVAQLFANKISKIRHGSGPAHTFVKVNQPGAVEVERGRVYATTHVLPPQKGAPDGHVVRYRR